MMQEAARLIRGASTIAMACHIGPDGDALGSMLGLAGAARAQGRKVYPSFGEPFVVPDAYRFLPVELLVRPGDVPPEPELMVTFDAGSVDRLGELGANASKASDVIVIDHHVTNEGFGTVNVIQPGASSTAEMVFELLEVLGWEIDEAVATSLLTGIVTDTGRFQYSNTSPRTLQVASRLVAAGARPEVIGQHVYEEVPFGYLAVAGAVLTRARLDPERRLAWSVLERSDMEAAGIGLDEVDPLIDAVRVAREADVALLMKHVEVDKVRVSLRSRGRVDVGAIAAELGGGGHHNAAGFTFTGSPDQVIDEVRSRLEPVGRIG
jgi:bifunctional oligoribonuclease and PAP phosphatase NrnA